MLVKYKTVLCGEKPTGKSFFDKSKDMFEPERVFKYEIVGYDSCCEEMENNIEGGHDWYFGGDNSFGPKEPFYFTTYSFCGIDGITQQAVHYCPFCGEKIEYKEVERSKYKAILKDKYDYIEEKIK